MDKTLFQEAMERVPPPSRGVASTEIYAKAICEAVELRLAEALLNLSREGRLGRTRMPGDDRAFWDEDQEPTL